MDHNVNAAARHVADEEAGAAEACAHAAEQAGRLHIAEDCDNGSVGCPRCPWRDLLPGRPL